MLRLSSLFISQSVDDAKCHPQAARAQVVLSDKGQGLLGKPGSLTLERL